MSCLDKIYTKSYQDYQDLQKWVKDRVFTTPRGVKINLQEYIIPTKPEYFQDRKKLPVMYSPSILDRYLYKNCPLQFVQDNLKRMYSGYVKELEEVLTKPEYEPCTKVRVVKKGQFNNVHELRYIRMSIKSPEYPEDSHSLFYNEDHDFWILPDEHDVWTTSVPGTDISIKAIIRKIIKKWKLPKGVTVTVSDWSDDKLSEWILETY